MSCASCLPMSSFSWLTRSATLRTTAQAKVSDTAQEKVSDTPGEKVLIMFGDSNFHYRPEKTFLRWLFGCSSVGDMVRAQLRGRVIPASSSRLDYRWSTMKLLRTSLETVSHCTQ